MPWALATRTTGSEQLDSSLTSGDQSSARRRSRRTGAYAAIDPGLEFPDSATCSDTGLAERGQRLLRYLAHAFRPFEHLVAEPAADTPFDQLLQTIEEILDR